ncbi:MAG: sugar transferase [Fibrobacter sp.]|nr:sugar transferase [Fibrobacter sp.]
MSQYQKIIKRLFDLTFATLGLLILWPAGLFVAVLIKIFSPGPVFFFQTRIGLHGKPFTCIKFRTMRIGAEKMGSVTSSTDSRITPIGKILRKYKFDEFPQLWNVLIGKMSFVGPRPDVAGYADTLIGDDRRMLALRPGITGPATIYFRYEEEILAGVSNPKEFNDTVLWPEKVRINCKYYDEWSFWKDFGYILITIIPVLNNILKLLPQSPCDKLAMDNNGKV